MSMFPPDRINSKIVGVNSGEQDSSGVPLRQKYLRSMKEKDLKSVTLVREPDNPYDPNAIAVFYQTRTGRVQVGYIQNSARTCTSCGKEYKKGTVEEGQPCGTCGGELTRDGLATELAGWMDKGVKFRARIVEFTGGLPGKPTLGCNICIDREA